MSQARRAIGILTSIAVICASAVVLQTRAADPPEGPCTTDAACKRAPQRRTLVPAAQASNSAAVAPKTAAAAESKANAEAAARPPASAAPQVPEESATIRDDSTIAPDPKQSADNNVSFPNDI
jgi:hypothetical protein